MGGVRKGSSHFFPVIADKHDVFLPGPSNGTQIVLQRTIELS
jgi:hypothetical protein